MIRMLLAGGGLFLLGVAPGEIVYEIWSSSAPDVATAVRPRITD